MKETVNPAMQKLKVAYVERALEKRGLDIDDPVKNELLDRVEVLDGHSPEPVFRMIDDARTLVSAEVFLDQVLNRKSNYVSPKSLAGPMRIAMTDKEAWLRADPIKVSRGEIVAFDDRLR